MTNKAGRLRSEEVVQTLGAGVRLWRLRLWGAERVGSITVFLRLPDHPAAGTTFWHRAKAEVDYETQTNHLAARIRTATTASSPLRGRLAAQHVPRCMWLAFPDESARDSKRVTRIVDYVAELETGSDDVVLVGFRLAQSSPRNERQRTGDSSLHAPCSRNVPSSVTAKIGTSHRQIAESKRGVTIYVRIHSSVSRAALQVQVGVVVDGVRRVSQSGIQ